MKRGIFLVIFSMIFGLGFLFYYPSLLTFKKEIQKTPEANSKIITHHTINSLPIIHARPLKNITKYTTFVGSVTHPTIDGGMINAANGIVVVEEPVNSKDTVEVKEINPPQREIIENQKTNLKPFEDNWLTLPRVRQLLYKAARDGKLQYVLNKSEALHLPASLSTIPMIESAYNTHAVSSKGAVGAWQLMPSIAKEYQINSANRFHFETSTNIALQHLVNLYKEFHNWELVLAAYNAGSHRVKKALAKNPHAKTIEELNLPLETKQYLLKLKTLNQWLNV